MGGATADALLKLGYPVSAWTRTPRARPGVRCYHGTEQLQEFAAGLDVLVCLLPLTDATRCGALALLRRALAACCSARRPSCLGGGGLGGAGRQGAWWRGPAQGASTCGLPKP